MLKKIKLNKYQRSIYPRLILLYINVLLIAFSCILIGRDIETEGLTAINIFVAVFLLIISALLAGMFYLLGQLSEREHQKHKDEETQEERKQRFERTVDAYRRMIEGGRK